MRPQIVVANKCEMPDTEKAFNALQNEVLKHAKNLKEKGKQDLLNEKVFKVSAATGSGVRELNLAIADKVAQIKIKALELEKDKDSYDRV